MKNWRQILSWKQVPREIQIGDKVIFIGSLEDFRSIDIPEVSYMGLVNTVGTIIEADPGASDNSKKNDRIQYGRIIVDVGNDTWWIPYSHWRTYIKVLDNA